MEIITNAPVQEDFYDATGRKTTRRVAPKRNVATKTAVRRVAPKTAVRRVAPTTSTKIGKQIKKPIRKPIRKYPPVQDKNLLILDQKPLFNQNKVSVTPDVEVKKGLSKGAKIGIAVGVAVVLGIIGFVVYKKMKKGGK